MRVLVRYILFLATTLGVQAQSSVWWYPLGPMEATRYQTAATLDTSTPVVRWRTSSLRNSPVVLVGALRPDSFAAQQIYGQIGNELRVLRSQGSLDTTLPISALFLGSPDASVLLTGLFNSVAPTPAGAGIPNTLGIGVTQTQADPTVPLYGLLLDPVFRRKRELWIERLNATSGPNAIASVYPIAHYSPPGTPGPIAFALTSQESYVSCGSCAPMVNGLRHYLLNRQEIFTTPTWSYLVAPRTYDQPPALAVDPVDQTLLVALTNSTYTFTPEVIVQQTARNRTLETSSDQVYTYLLRGGPVIDAPVEALTIRLEGATQGESHSYVVQLKPRAVDTAQRYRVVTENHDEARPGIARLYLRGYDRSLQLGLYEDSTFNNLAWSIVEADLDGTDVSVGRKLKRNPGREVIGMRRRLDDTPLDSNRIYIFRFGPTLELYAEQAQSGELLAAGDLVADPLDKDEIVVANGSSVAILRFRRFDEGPTFLNPPNYFDTVGVYTLDARVVSAAIADVEGDGSNDLIVVTTGSTYLIGRGHPLPLGDVRVDRTAICSSDSVTVSWKRAVGGGESGLRIELLNIDESSSTVVDPAFIPGADQSYVYLATGLSPGRYRLRFVDVDVASISGTSDEFVVRRPTIEPFTAPNGFAYEPVSIAVTAPCADSLVLEFSFDNRTWTGFGVGLAVRGDTTTVGFPMPCPDDHSCDALSERTIFFRFRTLDSSVVSPVRTGLVKFSQTTVTSGLITGESPRRRKLSWAENAFTCDTVSIALSNDNGITWTDVARVPSDSGSLEVDVEGELSQEVIARVCCVSGCGTGLAKFTVSEIGDADFIAPNPFDPTDVGEGGASIIYRLQQSGDVTIGIYDVSRALVRIVLPVEPLRAGLHRATWDGRNSVGDIVADGTYICVITSSSGDRITLPLSVAKR